MQRLQKKGLNEHLAYQLKKLQSLGKQNVVYLDHLEELPVSSNGSPATVNTTLNDLGLVSLLSFFLLPNYRILASIYVCKSQLMF